MTTATPPIPQIEEHAAAVRSDAARRSAGETVVLTPPPAGILRRAVRRMVRHGRAFWWRRRLAGLGAGSVIDPPAWIVGGAAIVVGSDVRIWRGARLEAHDVEPGGASRIRIGDGCAIHPFVHVTAVRSVEIGAGALLASNVYVTDHDHDFSCPDEPPVSNRRVIAAPTRIGAYAWLGEAVLVLRGVTIGEHAVIGAGSVVTRDVPSYAVAIGAPARVVRRYDPARRVWQEMVA